MTLWLSGHQAKLFVGTEAGNATYRREASRKAFVTAEEGAKDMQIKEVLAMCSATLNSLMFRGGFLLALRTLC